jgi:transcriptional regulator with XRE-family HTH domain
LTDDRVNRAVGHELRRLREARGLSRAELVRLLPSGIGDRTLLSYEHGSRQLTLLRFAELSWALGVDAPTLFARGLQRARVLVEHLTLTVDLLALLVDTRVAFRPLAQWARNTLNDHPGGIVDVEPAVVRNLARFMGCTPWELANYLARFTPDGCADERKPAHLPE